MTISIIVAVSKNGVIGNKGRIPWNIEGEKKRFKDLTTGNTIIIGRKSFEEMGKPLPNRKSIVISRTKSFAFENCITVTSLKEALRLTGEEKEVFIAGGGEIYQEVLPITNKIYLTVIEENFKGDVYFPKIDEENFEKIFEEKIQANITYTNYTYVRKDSCL